jgi:hypothetical protein
MAMIADNGLIAMVADNGLIPMVPHDRWVPMVSHHGLGACRRNNVCQSDHGKNGEDVFMHDAYPVCWWITVNHRTSR